MILIRQSESSTNSLAGSFYRLDSHYLSFIMTCLKKINMKIEKMENNDDSDDDDDDIQREDAS